MLYMDSNLLRKGKYVIESNQASNKNMTINHEFTSSNNILR